MRSWKLLDGDAVEGAEQVQFPILRPIRCICQECEPNVHAEEYDT